MLNFADAAASTAHPFVGLRPFAFEDAAYFFGREAQIDALERLIAQSPLITIVGSSGSGKSSLVRAGLLPRLMSAVEMPSWDWVEMRPGEAPIRNLAEALARPNRTAGADGFDPLAQARADRIELVLRQSSFGIREALPLMHEREGQKLFVLIDQFEEIFRFADLRAVRGSDAQRASEQRDEATLFVQLVLAASDDPEFAGSIALTMRSDFIGECARFHGLSEAVTRTQYLVPALTRDQRATAIRRPVEVAGGSIEPGLIQRVLNDTSEDPDQLPVLQHAMMRCWQRAAKVAGAGGTPGMTRKNYAEIGGVENALTLHGNELLDELDRMEGGVDGPRLTDIARQVFQSLTEVDSQGRVIRRPQKLGDLVAVVMPEGAGERQRAAIAAAVRGVVLHFADPACSFLRAPSEAELDADAAVDIGHEALIRRWERLGGREQTSWVRAELEDAEHYRDLLRYGQLGGLIPKAQLREFEGWWARRRPTRVWAQRYTPVGADKFDVAAEVLRRSRARVMRDRWLIGAGAVLVVLLIAVLAFLRAETVRAQLRYAQQLVEEKQAELAYQKYQAGVQAREAAERQAFFQEQARLSAEREARLVAFAGVQALATKSAYQALLLAQYGLSPASRLPLMPENEALAYDALQQMHERSVFQVARCVPPAIAFRPDGGLIAFADGSLRLWNPATGAEQTGWSIRVAMQWALALSLNPAGDEVLLNGVDGGQRRAILVDLKSRGVIPFAAGTEPGFGVFSPDGRLIVTSGPGRAVIIWALGAEAAKGGIDEGGAEMVRRPDPASAGAVEEFAQDPALAVSPSSRVLAISATGGRIDLVSLGERRAMTTLPDPRSANGPQGAGEAAGDVFSLAFDPRDGNRLLAIYRGGAAYLWNIGEQRRISLRTPARVIRALFSADGRFVAAVSSDELVRVWDLRDARGGGPGWVPAWIMRGSNGPFWTIAMADDGRIATGSMAGSVWLWERDAALARGLPRVPDSPDAAGPTGGAVSRNGTSVSMHGNQVIVRSAVAGQRSGALMIPPGVKMPAVPAIAQDGMWVLLAPVRGPILLYDLHDLHGPFGSALPVAAFGKRSSAWAWAMFAGAPDRVIGETRTGATHSWRFFRDPQALRSFATASLPLVDGRKPELPPAAREQVGGSFWSALSNADSASLDQGCR